MIGRTEEKEYLKSLIEEKEPQFVAVYGRRRIGKTYLIRESFEHDFFFQHTGISNKSIDEGSRKQKQLKNFAGSLARAGYESENDLSSWKEAFGCLEELIMNSDKEKKVIFLDELSWMDTKGGGFISALESFWNGFATARKEKDIVLIICASATNWIIDNVINSRGGLHNRLTGKIHLKPFCLRECEEYIFSKGLSFSRHQILQGYMIMGGVPYYWSLLQKGKSLAQNIDELFFKENALLEDEYDNLYRALFNKPDQYMQIVEALSTVNKGITRNEISDITGIASSGELTKKLRELENCGFIRKYLQFGYKENKCLFQLMDNYTVFYYKFLKDNVYDDHFWQNQVGTAAVNAWNGISFKKVCLEHIPQIKAALGISGVRTDVNTWQCAADPDKGIRGSQIDLLIVRKDQVINICEMKYSEDDYIVDAAFDRSQKRRMSDFRKKTDTKYALHSTLVTTYGVEKNAYAAELQSVVTMEDLFR